MRLHTSEWASASSVDRRRAGVLVKQLYNHSNTGDLDEEVELLAPDVVTVEPLLQQLNDHHVGLVCQRALGDERRS
jgi:hypothetical protein